MCMAWVGLGWGGGGLNHKGPEKKLFDISGVTRLTLCSIAQEGAACTPEGLQSLRSLVGQQVHRKVGA